MVVVVADRNDRNNINVQLKVVIWTSNSTA